jgi:radical SAM protein with 4Fe4S-binding SPASM domain
MKNLEIFQDYFNLKIKYNITKHNSSVVHIERFIDDILSNRELKPDYIIGLEAIQTTRMGNTKSYYAYDSDKLGGIYTEFSKLAHNLGVRVSIKPAFQPPCMFTSLKSYMIDTHGMIMSCDTAYEIPQFELGNIFSNSLQDLVQNKNRRDIILANASRVCSKKRCPYFPICQTGCYYHRHIKHNTFDASFCQNQYLATFFPGLTRLLLKEEYKNAI